MLILLNDKRIFKNVKSKINKIDLNILDRMEK